MTEKQTIMIAVGAYLRTLREGRGLKQEDIAYWTGISGKQVSNWEQGRHVPGSEVMALIIDKLQGDPHEVHMLLLEKEAEEQRGVDLANERLKKRPGLIPSPRPKLRRSA